MNKSEIKQLLDNLEVWDIIHQLDYKIDEIDTTTDILYTVSSPDFWYKYIFYDELYDELMEYYQDQETNEQLDSLKHNS